MHDRVQRRKVLASVAGAAAATAVATHFPGNTAPSGVLDAAGVRTRRLRRRRTGADFANRDDSYAQATGLIAATKQPPAPTLLYATAAEAAAMTKVTVPTILATDDPAVHLLRRASFAPTRAAAAEVRAKGIDAWIDAQLAPERLPDPDGDTGWRAFPLAAADGAAVRASTDRGSWDAMADYGRATMARQIWSTRQLYEVMVDFWANHLNVPTGGEGVWDVGPSYHRDVIRAHALGSFADMLLASARHPAMLRYLSNTDSTRQAVNENYGREILELHTVGIAAGYSETDVRNSAYVLTGRTTLAGPGGPAPEGTFFYEPGHHWTGRVQVMGFRHPNASAAGGLEVGDAYLRYLAGLPATAKTIARKLAVRFVSDVPPQSLVDRLAATYVESRTAIGPVLRVLFRSGEFWAAVGQKVRRPLENVVASARALGIRPGPDIPHAISAYYRWATDMGQRPFGWMSPNGYPDVHAAWRSAGVGVALWNNHRDMVGGWDTGLVHIPPAQFAADLPRGSTAERVDSLCRALCLQTFRPAHRAALVGFAASGPADADLELMALILDSPYFALR